MSNTVKQTKLWLEKVIIDLNFCPFAKKEFVNQTIRYVDSAEYKQKVAVAELMAECQYLLDHDEIETSLVIYQQGFTQFEQYLTMLDIANDALAAFGYEGDIQLASFHPHYCFEGEAFDDPANFTNRSPFPTVHLIREASLEKVLNVYQNPEQIPDDNIALAREKGNGYFEALLKQFKQSK